MPNVLYHLLSIMAVETQKGRGNFVSHHCLIKLLVEKYLHEVSDMTWEEFLNIHQFRPEHLQPMVLPQPRRVSRRVSIVETTLVASTSGASPSVNPPAAKQTIEISSSKIEHSDKGSSSLDSDDDVPLETLI